MNNDKVGIALIGCGTISWLNGPGYVRNPRCEVVALCDPVRERAELRANEWGISPTIYTDYEDVLKDPNVDAVELLTPTQLHAEQSIKALDAGRHVSCQKPIATTIAEADEMISAVNRSTAMFRMIENFTYYPPLLKVMDLLSNDVIGEPTMFRAVSLVGSENIGAELVMEPEAMEWREKPDINPGGLLYDDIWHKYATAMWLIGDVEKVSSVVVKSDDFYWEAPSAVTWKFKNKNCLGIFEMIHASEMPIKSKYYPVDDFFEIHGSKGVIWVTRCTGEMLDMPPILVHSSAGTREYNVETDWSEGFLAASSDFIEGVLTGNQPRLDVLTSKKVLQASLAAYRAAETGMTIDPQSISA